MKNLLPSDFMDVHPWDSIKQKAENESPACSIMATRHFKGNYWSGGTNLEISYQDCLDYRISKGFESGQASSEEFWEI